MTIRYLKASIVAACVVAVSLVLAACGGGQPGGQTDTAQEGGPPGEPIQPVPNASRQQLTVGSKDFEEQFILGQIYAQALRRAGYNVRTDLDIGDAQTAYRALRGGTIDMYPEYLGTALTSFYDVEPQDVPTDTDAAYQQTKAAATKEQITALPPTPFQNTFAPTMLASEADQRGIRTLSDLGTKFKNARYAGYPEFEQRPDGLLGLRRVYGIQPARFITTEEKSEVLDQDQADVVNFFSTDGELTLPKYRRLEDDKRFFPRYEATLLLNAKAARALGPDGIKVIEAIQKPMSEQVMQELNSRVVLDKQSPAKVAGDYLRESGFVR